MPPEIDVYSEWLGIKEPNRPLNYYQLLRIKQFEDDPVRIRTNYRKMNAHVRKYAAGDYATESQELLNELAKAMLCLTDAKRKAEYDASLGRKDTGEGRRRTFEELLLLRKVLDQAKLDKARTYADAVGLDLRDAVLQQKLTKPEIVMQLYAESVGLPYVELSDLGVEVEIAPKVPAYIARQHSCVPVMVDDGQLMMASPHPLPPDVEDDLRLRIGMPVRCVLCTASSINDVIGKHYSKEAAAAEMAAASAAPDVAAASPGKKADSASSGSAATPEQKRQQRMTALLAFNITFVVCMVFLQVILPIIRPLARPQPLNSIIMSLAIGAAGGAIGYMIAKRG